MNYRNPRLQTLLAGEFVLGLLHGAARRRFARLLMESRDLAAEVAAWEVCFLPWALTLQPVEPPRYLEWRLLGRIRAEATSRPEARRNTFWRVWAVAATFALALLLVARQFNPPPAAKPAEIALFADAQEGPLWLVSVYPEAGRLDLKALKSSPAPAGKSYELWMLPNQGAPRPLGLMNESGVLSESLAPALLARLASAKGLAISLEPQGGSPTGLPTGPILWTATLVAG